jgi:large subunit ribosomal protein L15e
MGVFKYIQKLWKNPRKNLGKVYTEHIKQWRNEPVTVRLDYPTRLDRARALGYKAKQGFIMVRQRVKRGGHMDEKRAGGRRSKNFSRNMVLNQSYQQVAEQRACKKFPNCEVLNSYPVGKDGTNGWYEVILIDVSHPVIKQDKNINWIVNDKGRAFRGKTSAARKTRGLRRKGIGAEKVRPSLRANKGRLH